MRGTQAGREYFVTMCPLALVPRLFPAEEANLRPELSGRLGVGLTVVRDSYEFGTAVFHQSSLVTISASLGLGVHWP